MDSSVSSMSPMTSPMEPEVSRTLMDPKQQFEAYVAWINSQLKKKPGVRLIEDLRQDMKDGVNFAHIIEVVSGEKISGIHPVPATYAEMRENLDFVLQFMTQQRIKMHRINSKDIVEGNQKAVMRLILALAAHYKPMSVRHSAYSRSPSKNQSVMGIAQGASAALTEARRNAKRAGRRHSHYDSRYHESSSEPCSDSDQSYIRSDSRLHPGPQERRELDGASASTSPVSSCMASPRTSLYLSEDSTFLECKSADNVSSSKDSGADFDTSCSLVDDSQLEVIKEVKRQLLQLQNLILTNNRPDCSEAEYEVFEGSTPDNFVILRSQLQHITMVSASLREELSRLKNECLQLQGTKAGLQNRLAEQDNVLSQLKSEKLHSELELQTISAENESLKKQIRDCNERMCAVRSELSQEIDKREQNIVTLRHDLMKRDQRIDQLQLELKQEKFLKQELQVLHSRLQAVGQTGASLSAKVAWQDRRMAELEGQLRQSDGNTVTSSQVKAELSVLQESLHHMQQLLSTPGMRSPPLDQLERSIITVLQNLRASRHPHHSETSPCSLLKECPDGQKYDEQKIAGPKLRPGVVKFQGRVIAPARGGQAGDSIACTSVIFFTDHSTHPSTCFIPGRLGEIKLHDFKNLFENPEKYRYYFKALDPEYGTVKEELIKDNAVIPGWEDKIVAWVESEQGTQC